MLVEHGHEVLLWNHDGMTARDLARAHGHAEIADFLAQHEPQAPTSGAGLTEQLLFAARTRNFATVQRILSKRPCLINMRDKKGRTPILCAVLADDAAMVRFLSEHGANIEAYEHHNYSSALALAICFRKLAMVRILVEELGASLTVMDNDGDSMSAAKLAHECGHQEIADYLTAQRAARRAGQVPHRRMVTPDFGALGNLLREAARSGDTDLAKQLIRDYPDFVGEPGNEEWETRDNIAFFNKLQASVEEDPDRSRRDLILKAIYDSDGEILHALVDDAHINLEKHYTHWSESSTPLVFAVAHEKLPVVKWLLKNAVISENQRGQALIAAVQRGNLPIVKCLIQEGHASVNVFRQENSKITALMAAVMRGSMPIVQELITQAHADPNMRFGRGGTAYDIACNVHNTEIAEFLAQHGGVSASALTVPDEAQPLIQHAVPDERDPLIQHEHSKHCCTLL
jgi:ankyrin repeat protein